MGRCYSTSTTVHGRRVWSPTYEHFSVVGGSGVSKQHLVTRLQLFASQKER